MDTSSTPKRHLRDMTPDELEAYVAGLGEPPYRYRQIASWLYEKLESDISAMTDLPLRLRQRLDSEAAARSLEVASEQRSALDGTRKFLFEMRDGALVESVLMQYGSRVTLCVSSQVGCALDCVFCQTGKGTYSRNLTAGEILDQIAHLKKATGRPADKVNVVFMGMGEPLMNFEQLRRAVTVLNHPGAFDMGSRRITVSTAGLPRRMRDLADAGLRCSLALSLNATTDAQRRALMPAVSRHTIRELLDAAQYYHDKSGRRVTLEYVLLRGVNTSRTDAKRLGKLAAGRPFKVNLIPYNCDRESSFEALPEDELQAFIRELVPHATVTVRRSRGPDIDAACGQLWTKTLGKKTPAKGT